MVIRSAFPSLTNSFLRMRGSTRIEMKLQSPRSLVLKVKKKNQKSRSACNLHNSFPADIDRVFIKPITFFSFLFFSFFSFCEYVLFADCPECKQYILWSSIDHLQGGLRRLVWRKPKNWKALHNMSIQSIAHGGGGVCKISESQVQPQDKLYPSVYCPRSFKIDGYESTPISDPGNTDMCCNCFHKCLIYLFISR